MSDIGRLLVFAGIGLVVIGGLIMVLDRLPGMPLGKLPGDFSWERGDVRISFPLATMVIVSILLTILINGILRFFR